MVASHDERRTFDYVDYRCEHQLWIMGVVERDSPLHEDDPVMRTMTRSMIMNGLLKSVLFCLSLSLPIEKDTDLRSPTNILTPFIVVAGWILAGRRYAKGGRVIQNVRAVDDTPLSGIRRRPNDDVAVAASLYRVLLRISHIRTLQ